MTNDGMTNDEITLAERVLGFFKETATLWS